MANTKIIAASYATNRVIYCIVRREADNFLLNDSDGTFSASPVDYFITLVEHSIIKGLYELSEARTIWNDGKYTAIVYTQIGGTPSTSNDIIVASGTILIKNDTEILSSTEEAIRSQADMGRI